MTDLLTIDFETYHDKDYSLRKLPTLVYIRDPRFLVYGAAVKWNATAARFIEGAKLADYLASVDWTTTATITYNSNFDNTILYERYGIRPTYRIDVLALCRALCFRDLDFDLDKICPFFGIPAKRGGGKILKKIKGIRELSAEQLAELADYAIGDAESTYALYCELAPSMPKAEADVQDLIIRMSTEGVLELDLPMLLAAEAEIEVDRQAKLEAAGTTSRVLRSRDQFAALLKSHGVEPPTKLSPTTGKPTWAFAKQDPDFIALLANPKVHDLIRARLAWASNNALSRIKHFQRIAELEPHTLPVQLNASGAHTHRLSGSGGINTQNMNRGSKLRLSIVAPKGHVIVVGDSGQAELRMGCWLSEQWNILELLKAGGDPYIQEAARQYGIPPEEVTDEQRFFGKTITLGCIYGLGGPTFRIICAAGPLGGAPILLTEEEASTTISTYRQANQKIKNHWKWLQETGLPAMLKRHKAVVHKCLEFRYEEIALPSGLTLKYPDLECHEEGWSWGINGRVHYIHGGVVANNTTQALIGELIREQMRTVARELDGLGRLVHQVHDELLVVCRERDADEVSVLVKNIMAASPSWAPDLPLAAKVAYAREYSK